MRHVDRFLSLLEGVKPSGAGWVARCPAHDDGRQSLSISKGEGGKILFHCFAGCPQDAVLDGVGLGFTDLWPGDDVCEDVGTAAPRPVADPAFCHEVYGQLLGGLGLSGGDRQRLLARGLSDAEIDRRGYRTLTFFALKRVVGRLRDEYGERLLSVPGFALKDGAVTSADVPSGLLIPVRDGSGRVSALQVRCEAGGAKYRWLSGGEVSSGSPAHVPLGVGRADTVRLTEGPLKADVSFALSGVASVGVAGVSAWASALPALEALGPKAVLLAFDADARHKAGVASALASCHAALKARYEVKVEAWEQASGKGIDDLLAAGLEPRVLCGAEAEAYVRGLSTPGAEVSEAAPITPPGPDPCASKGPEKFPYGSGPPAPFPLDSFPEPLWRVTSEISAAVNCPVDFAGGPMVAAAAAAVGRSRQIEPRQDWRISPRLYMAFVGQPGSGKTPALEKVMRPLWRKNHEWGEDYRSAAEEYEDAKLTYEARRKEFFRQVGQNAEAASSRRGVAWSGADTPAGEGEE